MDFFEGLDVGQGEFVDHGREEIYQHGNADNFWCIHFVLKVLGNPLKHLTLGVVEVLFDVL